MVIRKSTRRERAATVGRIVPRQPMTEVFLETRLELLEDYLESLETEQSRLATRHGAAMKELKSRVGATNTAAVLGISRQRVYQVIENADEGADKDLQNLEEEALIKEISQSKQGIEECNHLKHRFGIEKALRLVQLLSYYAPTHDQPSSSLSKLNELEISSEFERVSEMADRVASFRKFIRDHDVDSGDPLISSLLRRDDEDAATEAKWMIIQEAERLSETQIEILSVIEAW